VVAILLVTHHFVASDFIMNYELPKLLEARQEGLTIVWIAVGASLYEETPLNDLQAVNDPSRPLDSLLEPALMPELVRIAKIIKQLISEPAALE
jgi:hypothetical protein